MECPKCGEEMDFEDGINHWHIRSWYCGECDVNVDDDITGELIDWADMQRGER